VEKVKWWLDFLARIFFVVAPTWVVGFALTRDAFWTTVTVGGLCLALWFITTGDW
jgi:hypothetical protein